MFVFAANTERQTQTSGRMRFGAGYVFKLLCSLSGHKATLERTLANDKIGFFIVVSWGTGTDGENVDRRTGFFVCLFRRMFRFVKKN